MRVMDKTWYAVYTKPRAEKKLHTHLLDKKIISFLPLRKELKLWSDRKKWVEQPLLPSYLFVQVDASERFDVLNTPGAVRYISFEGKPTAIPDQQIVSLQQLITANPKTIAVDYGTVKRGDQVEVISGALRGIIGEVVQLNGRFRILLRFESVQCCIHAEIGLNEIKPLPGRKEKETDPLIAQ